MKNNKLHKFNLLLILNIFICIMVLLMPVSAEYSETDIINDNIQILNTNIDTYIEANQTIVENNDEFIPRITVDRSTDDMVKEQIKYRYNIINEQEFQEFVRVVEAEVTGSNPYGLNYQDAFEVKLNVAQVILNRVESPYFPDTIHDVIFQKNAFTPLVDGRYWEVDISQVTIDACKAALLSTTKDNTLGCEFFMSGSKLCKYGTYKFTDKVNHSFFKYNRND